MTKAQAAKAALFWAGFLFLLVTVSYIVRTNGDVKDRFAGFYAEPEDTIDVILAGSSPVYPFYSAPRLYGEQGIVSYPLSSNNQRPAAIQYLLREAQKTQSPSLFVIELRMFTMSDAQWEDTMVFTRSVTDNMKYSLNRVQAINALVEDKSQRYTYYFDIFKYHSNWKMLFLPSELACWRYEKPSPLKGLEIKTGVGPAQWTDFGGDRAELAPERAQLEALDDLFSYLKECGTPALFLISPFCMEQNQRRQFNYLTEVIQDAGYDVLDLNGHIREMGLDFSTDFYDYGAHVNALGEAKCTAFLGEYLRQNFDLPDRRGQPGYESWQRAWELYQREQAQAEASCLADIQAENWAPRPVE